MNTITDEQVREYILAKYNEASAATTDGYASVQINVYGYPGTRNIMFSVDGGAAYGEKSTESITHAITKFTNRDKAKSEAASLRATAKTLLAKADALEAQTK